MAVRTAYAAVAGEVLTAANVMKLPGGWIGYAEIIADQGSITTQVDLTGLTVTVTVGTARRIRVSADLMWTDTVAADSGIARIKEGAAVLQHREAALPVATQNYDAPISVVLMPSAGEHTYKLTGERLGTGTLTLRGSGPFPSYILVEDIGPAA